MIIWLSEWHEIVTLSSLLFWLNKILSTLVALMTKQSWLIVLTLLLFRSTLKIEACLIMLNFIFISFYSECLRLYSLSSICSFVLSWTIWRDASLMRWIETVLRKNANSIYRNIFDDNLLRFLLRFRNFRSNITFDLPNVSLIWSYIAVSC